MANTCEDSVFVLSISATKAAACAYGFSAKLTRAKTVSARRANTCEDNVFVGASQVFFIHSKRLQEFDVDS